MGKKKIRWVVVRKEGVGDGGHTCVPLGGSRLLQGNYEGELRRRVGARLGLVPQGSVS